MKEITDMFADIFDKLYNCVSYNVEDMSVLKHHIENPVGSKCMCNCVHNNHTITFTDCYDTIKQFKHSKSDGCTGILSDNIIHAGHRLACYLALHFTSMLCHGSSPNMNLNPFIQSGLGGTRSQDLMRNTKLGAFQYEATTFR